jgi:nitrogenase-stabilizing/protective protein
MSAKDDDGGFEPSASPDVLAALKKAGSAEEFFALLGVGYDPKVLNVARLHILKRMGEHLSDSELDRLPAQAAQARLHDALTRAYADFVASSPREQRVFKVLREAAAPAAPPFVPLDALRD